MKEKNGKKTGVILLAVLALLLVAAAGGYQYLSGRYEAAEDTQIEGGEEGQNNENSDQTEDEEIPPDFTVYDQDGNAVSLSSFRGKPVVINFWATWCGWCKEEMPYFQTMWETYGQDVHFLMINITDGYQETKEKGVAYVEESGYSFPVYYDTDQDVASKYYIPGLPMTLFLDSQGRAIRGVSGAVTESKLDAYIRDLMEKDGQTEEDSSS